MGVKLSKCTSNGAVHGALLGSYSLLDGKLQFLDCLFQIPTVEQAVYDHNCKALSIN